MAIEEMVDDFWREALTSNLTGPQAQAKWIAFVSDLQERTASFPKEAQDEVFLRAASRNAECIAVAKDDLEALRVKLGLSVSSNRLAEVAAETFVRATIWQSVASLFRLFR